MSHENIYNFANSALKDKIIIMYKNIKSKLTSLILLFFILTLIYIFSLNFLDNRVNDFCTKVFTKISKNYSSDKVVLIAVDDVSTDKINWPWSRDLFADIFNYIDDYAGAKAIVFQNLVIFPDSYKPEKDYIFYNNIKDKKNLINSFIFVNSNAAGDVLPSDYIPLFDSKINVNIVDNRTKIPNTNYKAVVNLPKDFLYSVNNLASSILVEDKDTILRSYMPVVQMGDKLYPSLALSAYAMYTGNREFVLYDKYLCSNDECKTLKVPISYKRAFDNLDNAVVGIYTRLNWYYPQGNYYSHKKYSAIDVLESYYALQSGGNPKINPNEFKDKIVIIGLNADKNVWEQLSETPVLTKQADIDVHAVMLSNMLKNTYKTEAPFDATLIITSIFTLFILFGFKRLKYNFIFALILSALYFIYYIFEYLMNTYIPPFTPIITMCSASILKQLYSIITTDKASEMIKKAMGKYVSKDVMKTVLNNLDKLNLGGIRTTVTVLFVDIRNFTQMSENLSPQIVTSILNEYFSTIEPIIAKYNGVINKYMGDGALAVFGEPIKDDNHALNAIKCGLEMTEKVKILRDKLLKDGKPRIEIGIGINTGEVFAGNIGTEERLEYTVIGDNVNLASRIEAYNSILKTSFLISQYTYEYVKDYIDTVKLSQVNIKGKSKPIDIYEVLKIKNER